MINYLMHDLYLYENRVYEYIFCCQHFMYVMNLYIVWYIESKFSAQQLSRLVPIYVSIHMWCTWLTIMDSTYYGTLCNRCVSNSLQCTLQNIHLHNTYQGNYFHHDFILPSRISMYQILTVITQILLLHTFRYTA